MREKGKRRMVGSSEVYKDEEKIVAAPKQENVISDYKEALLKKTYLKLIPLKNLQPAGIDINPYPPKPEAEFDGLVESIRLNGGIRNEIIVVELLDSESKEISFDGEPMKYLIVSGHSRAKAYEVLSKSANISREIFKEIPSKVFRYKTISADEMAIISHDENNLNRARMASTISLAIKHYTKSEAVAEMIRNSNAKVNTGAAKAALDYAAKIFGLEIAQAKRYYSVSRLPIDFIRLVDNKKISLKEAVKVSTYMTKSRDGDRLVEWIQEVLSQGQKLDKTGFSKMSVEMPFEEVQELLTVKRKDVSVERIRAVKVKERFLGPVQELVEILDNNAEAFYDFEKFIGKYK